MVAIPKPISDARGRQPTSGLWRPNSRYHSTAIRTASAPSARAMALQAFTVGRLPLTWIVPDVRAPDYLSLPLNDKLTLCDSCTAHQQER
jgi:hypothetical protein